MSQDFSATLGGPAPPEVPATTPAVPAITPAEEAHRFNLSSWTLKHQPLVIFLLVLITLFGVVAYGRLARPSKADKPQAFGTVTPRLFEAAIQQAVK